MTSRELVLRWVLAFVLTQCVECPIYIRAFRVRPWVAFGASAITHPIVVFVIPRLWGALYLAAVSGSPGRVLSPDAYFVVYGVLAETFAIVTEALWLAWRADLGAKRALVVSLVANVASSATGGICYLVTGYP